MNENGTVNFLIGLSGTLATLTLGEWQKWASIFAGVATGIYMSAQFAFLIHAKFSRSGRLEREAKRIASHVHKAAPLVALFFAVAVSLTACATRQTSYSVVRTPEGLERREVTHTTTQQMDKSADFAIVEYDAEGNVIARSEVGGGVGMKLPTYDSDTLFWIGAGISLLGVGLMVAKKWFPLLPWHIGIFTVLLGVGVCFLPYVGESVARYGLLLALAAVAYPAFALFYLFRQKPERRQGIKLGFQA